MEKETLEQQIQEKNKELEELKSKALSDIEKNQEQDRIQAEIDDLKTQLESLDVSISSSYLEIIKNTALYPKLKETLKTDAEVEKFSTDIDKAIDTYYVKELADYPQEVRKTFRTATEFAVTKVMITEQADVFAAVGDIDTQSGTSAFK